MLDEASETAESIHVPSPCHERHGTDPGLNRDLDWESHATSCRIGALSDQLREMQSWNALWVQPYRTGPGKLLQEMLTIDETTLHELSQPLPNPAESMTIEPEALIRARRVRIEKTEGDMRRLSIQKLKAVILIDPQATRLGQTLVPSKGREISDEEIRTSLDHAFSAKAGSTLYKRACCLIRYIEWCTKNADQYPLELTEEKLYSYLSDLKEVGGATSGSGFLEALRFLNGVAQFVKVDLPQVISSRVTGIAHAMFLSKKPLQQKSPMPVWIIEELEHRIVKSSDQVIQCIMGQLLWCYHAGGRWSDSQRLKKVEVHRAEDEVILVCDSLGSKTSLTKETKTRLVPYVCIGTGISGKNWGETWLKAREDQGIAYEIDDFFLPSFSCAVGDWIKSPMGSSEALDYLSSFVSEIDPEGTTGLNIGTHSMKSGFLTMLGRSTIVQLSAWERRVAGHHVDPGQKSMLTYSRESYTELAGKILGIYRTIRSHRFMPDLNPAERILAAANNLVGQQPQEDDKIEEDLDDESSSDEDEALVTEIMEEHETAPRCPLLQWEDQECVINKKSGIVHRLKTDDHGYTMCGRFINHNYAWLNQVSQDHAEDLECCILCGRH